MNEMIQQMSIMVLPLIFAVTLHEAAHAWVADKKGDPTARQLGRITMNPLSHIDPFGTVIIPLLMFASTGFIFGYAKPVPVNPLNLRRPKEDMAWVAAAGPGMNLLLAVISGIFACFPAHFLWEGEGFFLKWGVAPLSFFCRYVRCCTFPC